MRERHLEKFPHSEFLYLKSNKNKRGDKKSTIQRQNKKEENREKDLVSRVEIIAKYINSFSEQYIDVAVS